MSLQDYRISEELARHDYPFYSLIMAAMRKADDDNVMKLQLAWPVVWEELRLRYNAAGGVLESEHREDQDQHEDSRNRKVVP